jgi:hypothetical protein
MAILCAYSFSTSHPMQMHLGCELTAFKTVSCEAPPEANSPVSEHLNFWDTRQKVLTSGIIHQSCTMEACTCHECMRRHRWIPDAAVPDAAVHVTVMSMQEAHKRIEQKFAKGKRITVIEPYTEVTVFGDKVVRVDRPADVRFPAVRRIRRVAPEE